MAAMRNVTFGGFYVNLRVATGWAQKCEPVMRQACCKNQVRRQLPPRQIQGWVAVKEIKRAQLEVVPEHWHDGPVLTAHDVVHPDRVPEHHVRLFDAAIRLCPCRQTLAGRAEGGIVTGGIPLFIAIRRHPQGVIDETRTASWIVVRREES